MPESADFFAPFGPSDAAPAEGPVSRDEAAGDDRVRKSRVARARSAPPARGWAGRPEAPDPATGSSPATGPSPLSDPWAPPAAADPSPAGSARTMPDAPERPPLVEPEHAPDHPRGGAPGRPPSSSPLGAPARPPERPRAGPREGAPAGPVSPDSVPSLLREAAVPELQAAMTHLLQRGHEVTLRDDLDLYDQRILVRFRPEAGPLRGLEVTPPAEASRFELGFRVEGSPEGLVRPASEPARITITAGYVPGSLDTRFLVLGRVDAAELTGSWVGQRFVDFVRRTLDRT